MTNTQLITTPLKRGATSLKKKGIQGRWKEWEGRRTGGQISQSSTLGALLVNGQKRVEVASL